MCLNSLVQLLEHLINVGIDGLAGDGQLVLEHVPEVLALVREGEEEVLPRIEVGGGAEMALMLEPNGEEVGVWARCDGTGFPLGLP